MVEDKIKQIIIEITEKIKKEYKPEKIILFGSHAYGKPNEDSDIDLLIIKETSERPVDRRIKIMKILSDPNRRIPIELIVVTSEEMKRRIEIGDQFAEEILSKGKELYAA